MEDKVTSLPEQIETDLLVIGGGGSGLAAALTAAENGISNILVLEKRGGLGGNTARATGLFACESPAQARDKIIADKDDLFKRAMHWAHWSKVNPRIFRAFLNKSGETINWLERKGLEFKVISFFPNQNPRVEHVAKGKGAEVIQILADNCQKAGVKIILNAAGAKIRFDDHGSLTGAIAFSNEKRVEIKARSVVIATGGFAGNKSLLQRLCPHYYEDMPLRGLPLMGDGILMAEEARAAIDSFVTLLKEGPRVDAHVWPLGGLERDPLTVWVNQVGKRFTDETTGDHPFESVNSILGQPDRVCFSLADTAVVRKIAERITGLEKSLESEVARGRVTTSASWQQIARWIGAEPAVLQSTVEEYNQFCDRGYDAVFAKDRRYLMPLRTPPYFAIRGYPYFLDTLGGIRVNEHMETLDCSNKPLAGLFAAGVTTSGWESDSYCSDLSGSAFGYAINSGRIAGESAASFIKGEVNR
ncbi:MAG TPA: FAD-dependent oxidoreductase [Dehalococcoidales bacterium]|nr:FAD-dependent oxidoreductase [Dehalococcoidales bacterium]